MSARRLWGHPRIYDLVEAIADPNHEQHKELRDWFVSPLSKIAGSVLDRSDRNYKITSAAPIGNMPPHGHSSTPYLQVRTTDNRRVAVGIAVDFHLKMVRSVVTLLSLLFSWRLPTISGDITSSHSLHSPARA